MKKKKGFTLIELIASMTILIILFTFGSLSLNYYKNLNEDIKLDNFFVSLKHMLAEGKAIAIDEDIGLRVAFDNTNKKVILQKGIFNIGFIDMPYYIYVVSNPKISISSNGQLKSQTTTLNNTKDNKKYYIKIRAGVDYVKIES